MHSFAERWAQQHLGHHPQLDFIAALQQQLQCHCVAIASMAAEDEIDQLLLQKNNNKRPEMRIRAHFRVTSDKIVGVETNLVDWVKDGPVVIAEGNSYVPCV